MNNDKIKNKLEEILKQDQRLVDDKNNIDYILLFDLLEKYDSNILSLLFNDDELKNKFFVKIADSFVFRYNDFRFFIERNKVDNSYTAYKNRIGLTDGKKFLKDTNDVVLDFPYKDCILEGGQSTEEGLDTYFDWQETTYKDKLDEDGNKIKDGRKNVKEVDVPGYYEQKTAKRKEIFFNSVLAHDEIDRLFDAKALTNWKRYTKDGEIPLNSPLEGWTAEQDGVDIPKWQAKSLFPFWTLPKNKNLNQRAKELRKQGILSEVLFWKAFKDKQKIKNYDIDRQVIIGNFIVDFFIAELGLVIEIDGSSHNDKQEYDKERQEFLEGLNLKIIRYADNDVKQNIDDVYKDFLNNIEVREKQLKESTPSGFQPATPQEGELSTPSNSANLQPLKRGIDGTIKENLIIKGNNLLALHSLKKQFAGKVKLIYIDPPYNTGNDGFRYNDNFNHSTWLTFMKNRLEVARELLRDDGVIFVQCDHHEMGYLNLLLDNIFGIDNKIQQIAVKVASASGFKAVNPGPIDVLENILYYAKNKKSINFIKNYVPTGYHKNYNKYFERTSENINEWKLIPLKDKVLEINGYKDEKELKDNLGKNYKIALDLMTEKFAFQNANDVVSVRDLHKPTKTVKDLQDKSKHERDKIFVYEKQDGDSTYIINGGAIAFYSSKIKEIDGEKQVTELLTNFWDHISWAGIAKEGGVSLKNGKKPEALLKEIIGMITEKNDIVLDYHLGSGTTSAVAHKMGRQYIGIEQLDYGENDSVVRLQNVINGDQSGISKSVNWQGGGDFIYFELAKWNETAKEKILACESLEELINFFDEMYERYFLNYNLKIKEFKEKVINEKEFKNLPLDEQKKMFVAMLDNNQMYVNKTEMADKKFGISEEDQRLTEEFYKGGM